MTLLTTHSYYTDTSIPNHHPVDLPSLPAPTISSVIGRVTITSSHDRVTHLWWIRRVRVPSEKRWATGTAARTAPAARGTRPRAGPRSAEEARAHWGCFPAACGEGNEQSVDRDVTGAMRRRVWCVLFSWCGLRGQAISPDWRDTEVKTE